MEYGKTLIADAATALGSRYKVSQASGVPQSTLSEIVAGNRPIPPRVAGRIAELIGADPREAALMALVDNEKDDEKRGELMRMFRLRIS